MFIWILLAIIVIVVLAGGAYFAYTKYGKKDSATSGNPAPGPVGGSTLNITENGASVTENYMMMPKRERYIQIPDVGKCLGDEPLEYCSAYSTDDGLALVYDLSLSNITTPEYTECPGGGHDCWYTEKFDQDGTLIAITNKQGESLLDKLADDIWSGALDMNHAMFREVTDAVEMKDGTLVLKKSLRSGDAGDPMKPTDLPGSIYFVALFSAMKLAGMEKPERIVVNIKGAKDAFRREVL